ncbi:MAG: DUF1460 domain-containing protein [Deltaproteobacteria bacterium]|nr:DUF1460 domain-containing protein [Deltaproteobacteria bacterium]
MMPVNELALKVGNFFLNTPYVSSTLDVTVAENLVINLRQMDCFTFLENVIVLTKLIREKRTNFEIFAATLQKVRYRDGKLQGYSSRLHYFCDWYYDNQLKGFIFDITRDLGGVSCKKNINFMTKHPDLYPALKKSAPFNEMLSVEKDLSSRSLYRLRKANINQCTDKIKDGDIIAVTTNKTGLDVLHAGFAIYLQSELHLLHASKTQGKVIVSKQTLFDYLEEKKERTGILVGRIL